MRGNGAPGFTPQTMQTEDRSTDTFDPERQRKAREYAGIQRRLFFVELGLGALALVLFLVTGASAALRDRAESISREPWAVVALYGVVLGGAFWLLSLPLDVYAGYTLPRRYGLLTQTLRGWAADTLKSLAIAGVIGIAGLEVLYFVLRAAPDWWWLIMAALLWLFTVAMAQLAPVLLMPLFYRFRPLDEPELVRRLTALAERAGARVRGVYVMDMSSKTPTANAMLAGLGRTRRIILGDTLLSGYTHDEIETVMAHELAHHVHRDILRALAAEAVVITASMWAASVLMRWGVGVFGFRGIDDVAALPLFVLAMGVVGLITMPAANFMSRRRERAADLYALRTTGNGAAYRSVMLKLADQNLSDADPPAWVRFLFYSHPPVSERVRTAESFARAGSIAP
ncbi:MAG TPA: M48 family metallopeptidase [Chloroflexia bacterium]|nr:M48 family metallopeptidase [Chloroflexia bacterium]